jgi:hypothetical protein
LIDSKAKYISSFYYAAIASGINLSSVSNYLHAAGFSPNIYCIIS